jgi:hypothetical protein
VTDTGRHTNAAPDPWYGATDRQVVTAIQSLGLDVFPFGAYDPYGRLKVDPKVTDDLKRELHEVIEQPVWTEFFKVLSLFDNPGYDAYSLGCRVTSHTVKVAVFRQLNTFSNPQSCATLQHSIALNLLPQLREYAGKRYFVDPKWIEALRKILSLVGGSAVADHEDVAADNSLAPLAGIGWSAVLGIVLDLVEIANQIGRNISVHAVVIWRYPSFTKMTIEQTRRWHYIGAIGDNQGTVCTGVLWDVGGRCVWHWTNTWPWPSGFAFAPGALQSALYPSGFVEDAGVPPEAGPEPPEPGGLS